MMLQAASMPNAKRLKLACMSFHSPSSSSSWFHRILTTAVVPTINRCGGDVALHSVFTSKIGGHVADGWVDSVVLLDYCMMVIWLNETKDNGTDGRHRHQ